MPDPVEDGSADVFSFAPPLIQWIEQPTIKMAYDKHRT